MSTQEILLEEIKRQPELILRKLSRYLDFLKKQHQKDSSMENVVAETWEKLGPAPEICLLKL